jgi:arginine deiminase
MHMAVRTEKAQAAYGCEEFGRLESVLVHTPGEELLCLNESNYRQWLFDRVPDIDRFVAEHARWCHLLEENGVEVNQLADHVKVNSELLRELPNVMYLHDTAVVTSRGAILSRMLWPARRREEVVVGEALADLGIPTWIDFPRPDDGFEGCLLLSPETVLVAYTERHVAGSIRRFIPQALEATCTPTRSSTASATTWRSPTCRRSRRLCFTVTAPRARSTSPISWRRVEWN